MPEGGALLTRLEQSIALQLSGTRRKWDISRSPNNETQVIAAALLTPETLVTLLMRYCRLLQLCQNPGVRL